MEEDFKIIHNEKVGKYYLDWSLDELMKHVPSHAYYSNDTYKWYIYFDRLLFGVSKMKGCVTSIQILGDPRYTFLDCIHCGSTIQELKNCIKDIEQDEFTFHYYSPSFFCMFFVPEEEDDDVSYPPEFYDTPEHDAIKRIDEIEVHSFLPEDLDEKNREEKDKKIWEEMKKHTHKEFPYKDLLEKKEFSKLYKLWTKD